MSELVLEKASKEQTQKTTEPNQANSRKTETTVHEFSVNLTDKNQMYSAYMSFLKPGGLFVSSTKKVSFGDKVLLKLQLGEDNEKFSVPGEVVWITPPAAQAGRQIGVGVQFVGNEAKTICDKIENYLAGTQNSERINDTM